MKERLIPIDLGYKRPGIKRIVKAINETPHNIPEQAITNILRMFHR